MLHVACCLWQPNEKSESFSRCYDESWVEKLYGGFKRNLTRPFQFICFTDRHRKFRAEISQLYLTAKVPDYGCLIEPFRLNVPMILVGLDTVIVRNIDHMADYCLSADKVALSRNPYQLDQSINAVALVPAGQRRIYDEWRGENDMEWLRKFDCNFIDDLWPYQVLSFKAHKIVTRGIVDARIVYFHGDPKPSHLLDDRWLREKWRMTAPHHYHLDWIKEHWRA